MTPTIGITTYHTSAAWRGWSEEGALLPWTYVASIRENGGSTVLLPPNGDAAEAAAEAENIVSRLDGVVIAGGADIDPAMYGAPAHPRADFNSPDRDVWELAVAESALKLGVPLLGICRGAQMLNVASGGTLHQHIPDLVGHEHHSGTTEGFGTHKVRVTAGSILKSILPDGGDYFAVPTHHHQAVDKLGDGLVAVAWAGDGIVEAIESELPGNFVVGVQWHPEAGTDPRLFQALIAAAGRYAAARTSSMEPHLLAGA
ncbi:MAG TPA: gamma-glutamyl-gamma-aminobutyrate hydrolase family protein [Trebonia sp.]|jgi:putative glutamine amidotransferase|nr:gamma-glutamyl-gamma-aminobutyrate hydrolase family protein [Trebonia sp.]